MSENNNDFLEEIFSSSSENVENSDEEPEIHDSFDAFREKYSACRLVAMESNVASFSHNKFKYENVCEIQIKGLDNLKEKAFMATSVFVEKDFDGIDIDLTKKIIIYVDNDGCVIQNV